MDTRFQAAHPWLALQAGRQWERRCLPDVLRWDVRAGLRNRLTADKARLAAPAAWAAMDLAGRATALPRASGLSPLELARRELPVLLESRAAHWSSPAWCLAPQRLEQRALARVVWPAPLRAR
jgi:hypothetical protein